MAGNEVKAGDPGCAGFRQKLDRPSPGNSSGWLFAVSDSFVLRLHKHCPQLFFNHSFRAASNPACHTPGSLDGIREWTGWALGES
jgi:hypothetical protein